MKLAEIQDSNSSFSLSCSSLDTVDHQSMVQSCAELELDEVNSSSNINNNVSASEDGLEESDNESIVENLHSQKKSWLSWNYSWSSTSEELLNESEEQILAYLTTPYKSRYVNIGKVVGNTNSRIWTVSLNEESDKTPLVLLHGMGAGVALWILNLDDLAERRPVYAVDLLGFGRSSRPTFSSDPLEAESQMASSIEAWRKEMKLEKFVLLGHSLGGYISTAYSLRFPQPVVHLILADPWGFKEKPDEFKDIRGPVGRIPLPIRVLLLKIFEQLNPLWAFRLIGPKLIQKLRPDLIRKYENFLDDPSIKISHYMYHCNAQNPTGETAFHTLMAQFGWAKNPMGNRITLLDKNIPMTLLYGSHSWVDHFPADKLKELRGVGSYCDAHILEGAGHHVYADKKEIFNELVLSVCSMMDK